MHSHVGELLDRQMEPVLYSERRYYLFRQSEVLSGSEISQLHLVCFIWGEHMKEFSKEDDHFLGKASLVRNCCRIVS